MWVVLERLIAFLPKTEFFFLSPIFLILLLFFIFFLKEGSDNSIFALGRRALSFGVCWRCLWSCSAMVYVLLAVDVSRSIYIVVLAFGWERALGADGR